MGPLDARFYRYWLYQGNDVMLGLEGRAGGGGEHRSGVGLDGDSTGGGRGLRLLVGGPLPHEHRAMVLVGLGGSGRPVLLCSAAGPPAFSLPSSRTAAGARGTLLAPPRNSLADFFIELDTGAAPAGVAATASQVQDHCGH